MNPADPSEATLFEAALERVTPEARAAYLDQACARQPELRRRVEGLLAAYDQSDKFLERPAANNQPTIRLDLAPEESPGTVIGRYKLLQKIGEGGMGVVYMAEQTEPVIRKVALKIIKLGMDTKQVVARFEAERQALALMDHPNIAKVLDAGTTETPLPASGHPLPVRRGEGQGEGAAHVQPSTLNPQLPSGRPYFVMELVHGVPITEYCDKNKLSTQERLELFIPVCQAIQHAHQKGIIHRDIKPSNVMVTLHDGVPVPKVIDFGVAKATNQRLTEKTLFTHYAQMIGTPAYMSPEQAEMSGLDIDTRSDIYSLGVLLYELLTGTTPFDAKELLSKGYAEMQRIIAQDEPPKPSTRMSTLRDEQRTVVASNRSMDASALRKVLQGDLDWIVMKCLEKDRTRRYETSNGLAADLRRHLSNELITARPPTTGYLLKKLMKRNKAAFATAAIVAASLLIGIVATTWQAIRARQAESRALATVEELRGTAPAFVEQARGLVAQSKFDEAITKLDYAVKLRPNVADYLVFKANLLQCQLKLAEAGEAYHGALKVNPAHERAKFNLKLTEELVASQSTSGGKLASESLAKLLAALQSEQRSAAELLPVSQALGKERDILLAYWLERLKDLPIPADKPLKDRLRFAESGRLTLDLSNTSISDLSPLANMPLGLLDLSKCPGVTDLGALRGLPLRTLWLNRTQVRDLAPLTEIPTIVRLDVFNTRVSDLSPLRGLKLQYLDLTGCNITDLSPLSGMPLTELRLRSTRVTSLAPLRGMPLKWLDLTLVPALDFDSLSGLPLETLFLADVRVNDLSFLAGMPLKKLSLWNAKEARNFSILSQIQTLELVQLPQHVFDLPESELLAIDALQQHPGLRQIANEVADFVLETVTGPKEEFWPIWNAYRDIHRGKYEAAEKTLLAELTRVETIKAGASFDTRNLERALGRLVEVYDRAGRTADALELQDRVLVLQRRAAPGDANRGKHLALLRLWLGKSGDHESLCRQMLDFAATASDVYSHDRAAKAYLLRSDPEPETLERAVFSTRQAVVLAKPGLADAPWFRILTGLASYRTGKFAEAETILTDELKSATLDSNQRELALVFRAMALWQLGRKDEARSDLAEIEKLNQPNGVGGYVPHPGLNGDRLAISLALNEARALLKQSQ